VVLTAWVAALGPEVVRPPGVILLGSILVLGVLLIASINNLIARNRHLRVALESRARGQREDRVMRHRAEQALRVSQAYFSNIVELSEDAVISMDAKQRIRLFNHAAERTFGYRADEVLGEPLDVLIPQRFHISHRRHVEAFGAAPEPLRPMNERGTLLGRRKDGTEFPIEASISKFEVQGEQVFFARLRDVTERRRAEEGLQHLAAIVESSDDAILGETLDGVILSWNAGAQRLYGYTAAEITGRPVSLLLPPDRPDEVAQILEQIRRGGRLTQVETVRVRKDGVRLDVSLSVSPIRDAAGRIVGASAIARDITERKRLEAQIRQAQKMEALGTLAGGIAHDFNNILAVIMAQTEMAADGLPEGGELSRQLQEILVAADRARDLVRQILTFSRRTEQERRPVAVQAIVAEAMRLLRASLPATVEFRQQVEPGRALVLADPTQLHQVVLNLCTNAEHAMRERGGLLDVQLRTVEVDAEFVAAHPPLHPGSHVKLTVRDTGHGMSPQVQERIFDPFFTTKPRGEGTGMGLAVVHGIVASHGGAITVESAPGRGTRFDIYLPRCDGAEAPEIPVEAPARGLGERILLVDDEPLLVRIGAATLERLGYRVARYTDGREALEAFRADPDAFDLVITDQTMPQMTGETLARELLRLRPRLPIILCTGFSHAMTEDKARSLGIRALLMKPVSRQEFCLTVQRLLAERPVRFS
jgi:PAS domain S-box-containing protein